MHCLSFGSSSFYTTTCYWGDEDGIRWLFDIQYGHCGSTNRVAYGKTYIDHKRRGQRNFTVNTKLGAREVDTEESQRSCRR